MKKQLVSLLALSLVGGAAFALPETKTASAAGSAFGFAEYVSVENAPTIDGQIDEDNEPWYDGYNDLYIEQSDGAAAGIVYILWNETGLYFLAEITDPNVNNTDRCNFWVSETYYEGRQAAAYPFVDGAYFLCVNSNNTMYDYRDPDAFEGNSGIPEGYQTATSVVSDGYIVEAYVPLTGELPLEKGNSIGFDCSIDNFETEGADREGYRYWAGLGAYWENPTMLGEIFLVDYVAENGVAPTPTPSTSSNSSSSTANSVMESESGSEESSSSGCMSSIAFAPMGIALLAGVALMKKKK